MSRSSNIRGGQAAFRTSIQPERPKGASGGGGAPSSSSAVSELLGFDPDDIDPEELRDFMAADWVEVKADPGFRERLREQLWDMLRAQQPGESEED